MNANLTPTINTANRPRQAGHVGQPGQASRALRIGCMLAAMVVTALSMGAQLGLAHSYTEQADAVLVAQRHQPLMQAAAASSNGGDMRGICLYDALARLEGIVYEQQQRPERTDPACQHG
jgi:hypothetical protein